MIHHVATWLKKAPNKSEIVEFQNGVDKVKIIPQKIIETLLDQLTDQNWSTENFRSSTREVLIYGNVATGEIVDRKTFMDASLELVVTYTIKSTSDPHDPFGELDKTITRRLVGAYTFDIDYFGNSFTHNTAKSLCISNAASDLGRRFGKDLNPSVAPVLKGMAPGANRIVDTLVKITK